MEPAEDSYEAMLAKHLPARELARLVVQAVARIDVLEMKLAGRILLDKVKEVYGDTATEATVKIGDIVIMRVDCVAGTNWNGVVIGHTPAADAEK